jgi:putative ABC transport system permease protein
VSEVDLMILPEILLQDLRYGIRMLRRNAGFTAVAILALALGIGVNTAVLTAYKAMVARPLQARDPSEMVNLTLLRTSGGADYTFSYSDYESYRDSLHSFRGLIATSREQMRLSTADGIISQRTSAAESGLGRWGLLPSGASNAEFASVLVVSGNYFKVLGVTALRGRTFDSIGIGELLASPSVLISENFWRKRFAGDPTVLGKTIRLNGAAVTIVGITPHDFVGTHVAVPDFWLPLRLEPLVHADSNWLRNREHQFCRLFGRLAPGVSMAQAQAETTLEANRLSTLHDPRSEWAKPATALVSPGSPLPVPLKMNRPLALTILFIVAATGMVLAVACADVGSLQLVRARSRQNELETRLALGASRLRIIRQLLTESALVGVLAGVLAFPFTWVFLKFGVTFAAEAFPADFGTLIFDVTPNLQVFGYVLAMSLAAGILFGLAPALEGSRSARSLAARGSTSPAPSRRIQDFLVAAQVALSLVLMIAGSMLVRSSINALKMETGYDTKHVVDLDLQFPEAAKYTAARKLALVGQLRTRLAALPGVVRITSARPPGDYGFLTAAVPSNGGNSSMQRAPRSVPWMHYTFVQANYFQTLGIPIALGRGFQSQAGQPERSIVLSESAARQLWPEENAVGHDVRLGSTDEQIHNPGELRADGPAYRIIGIARDMRGFELNGSDSRLLYLPLPEDRLQNYSILIRTQTDPQLVMRAFDSVIASVDPDLVATSSTLEEMLRRSPSFIVSSLAAAVATTVGLLGLLLALMGIYGTVSYLVVLRTREIGIRMAVGAQKRDILGLILRESTLPVLAGLVAGMFLAVGASYLLRGMLYGLSTVDGVSFTGVSLLFLGIALLAAYPPSRRAMRVDPLVALRYE